MLYKDMFPEIEENHNEEQEGEFACGDLLIESNSIDKVSENTSDDVQDYDLVLSNGQEVVLHKENCNGKKPKVGDYFHICHKSHIFLHPKKEFEEKYEKYEEVV